jgi:branched-subunit amino acid aminotransferase/4-amino-4-deoxychorismate lyase
MTLHSATPVDPADPPRWRLVTSTIRLGTNDPLASFKTSSRLLQVLARSEAERAGADEALLLNTSEEVAETSAANIFWVHRGTIHTTPAGRGALPGVTRAVVLELCQNLSLPTRKSVIMPEGLRHSDGVFLAFTSLGIVPVVEIDGEVVRESPLTHQICQAYWDAVAKG